MFNQDNKTRQLITYIYENIIKDIIIAGNEKILFAIDEESLQNYVGQMPFSKEFLKKLQRKPFEVRGLVYGLEHAGLIDDI